MRDRIHRCTVSTTLPRARRRSRSAWARRRLGQRVRRHQRPPVAGGDPLERTGGQAGDAAGQRHHPRAQAPADRDRRGRPRRRMSNSVGAPAEKPNITCRPPGRSSSSACRPTVAAHAVVHERDAAGVLPDLLGPAGLGVVDDLVGAERRERGDPSAPPAAATTVAPTAEAAWTSSQPRPPAADGTRTTSSLAGGSSSRTPSAVRPVPTAATASGEGHVLGHGEELVRRRSPPARRTRPAPCRGARPPGGRATTRRPRRRPGRRRRRPRGPGWWAAPAAASDAGLTAPEGGVEQVHPGRLDGDPHLAGCGVQVGQLVEDQVAGGSELVMADGVHARHPTSSSELEVNSP